MAALLQSAWKLACAAGSAFCKTREADGGGTAAGAAGAARGCGVWQLDGVSAAGLMSNSSSRQDTSSKAMHGAGSRSHVHQDYDWQCLCW